MPGFLLFGGNTAGNSHYTIQIARNFPEAAIITAGTDENLPDLAVQEDPEVVLLFRLPDPASTWDLSHPDLAAIPLLLVRDQGIQEESLLSVSLSGIQAFINESMDDLELRTLLQTMMKMKVMAAKKERGSMSLPPLKPNDPAFLEEYKRFRQEAVIAGRSFDAIGDAIMLADSKGTILRCNAAASRLSGLATELIIGQPYTEIIYHSASPQEGCPLVSARKTHKNCSAEINIGEKWYSIDADPIVDEPGEIEYFILLVRDITQRKKTEEALRISEEALYRAQEASGSGSWELDIQSGRLIWSRNLARMLGSESGIDGTYAFFLGRVHPEDVRIVEEHYARILETRQPAYYDLRILLSDDRYHWIRNYVYGEVSGDTVVRLQGISMDVTDKIQKEAEIKKLSLAIEQSPVSVIITDLKGNIEYINRTTTEMTGYTVEELVGHNVNILKSGKTDTSVYRSLWETITSGLVWEGEWINRRKDGEFYWEKVFITHIFNEAGAASGYLAIKEDVTENKKAEAALVQALGKAEESSRLKTAFLNNMSHELRTPLNAIIGFTELLPEASESDKEYFTTVIRNSSNQLINLFEDTIFLSRLQSEKITLETRIFSPAKLLADLYRHLSLEALNSGLETNLKIPAEQKYLRINADESKIRQVLTHLISNALKYTEKGSIELGCLLTPGKAEFYVSDTGIGVPAGERKLIFDNFFRGEKILRDAIRGTGIGLNISRELVVLMGGEIGLESPANGGSRFFFRIPVESVEEDQSGHEPARKVKKQLKETRILVVEDDYTNYRVIEYLLRGKVKSTTHAVNGEEAIQLFSQNHYDLVIMDMRMPVMGGLEASQKLRQIDPEVIIIGQSAYSLPNDRKNALEAGCVDFLQKPVRREVLLDLLYKHTSGSLG